MGHRGKLAAAAAFAWLLGGAIPAAAEPIEVVATVKPVHSLVAGVMEGVGTPTLLIGGGGSPHTYSMRPSDAAALRRAKVVVRVSERLETFLNKPIESLARDAVVVELDEAPGIVLREPREGGAWDTHDHGHGHGHAHGKSKGHGHKSKGHGHAHAAHAHHDDEFDAHLWLDPLNAKAAVAQIAEALAEADPVNGDRYRANADKLRARLDDLHGELEASTKPLVGKPFVVFHDAYQYFEARYGLAAAGSITVSPERQPGARRLAELRKRIGELGAACVFAEPQFEPRLVTTVTQGTKAKPGVLDPLGAALEPGPDLYFELMRGLARSLAECLDS